MKFIKMLGLTVVAAIAAMAFVGASSAMAGSTALCAAHEDPCASPLTNQHIEGLATNPQLLSAVNVTCNHSVVLGSGGGLSAPLTATAESINFTGDCLTGSGTSCTVTTVALGTFLLLRTALNLGTLESHGNEVNVHCGALINCTYGGLPVVHAEGSVSGGLGTISTNSVALTRTAGAFCPKEAHWDATYTITLPDPVYITT